MDSVFLQKDLGDASIVADLDHIRAAELHGGILSVCADQKISICKGVFDAHGLRLAAL